MSDDPFLTVIDQADIEAALQRQKSRNARLVEQETEIARLRAKVDAVYSERNRLAAAFARMALAAGFKAGKGVDPDETKWPVVYVDTPNGQVSWHIAEADQGVLEGLPQYDGKWDGAFTARDPSWPVWPAADLVATARREGMKDVAKWHEVRSMELSGKAGLARNFRQLLRQSDFHMESAAAIRAAAGEGE